MDALQIFDLDEMPATREKWERVAAEYGNDQLETLLRHFCQSQHPHGFIKMNGKAVEGIVLESDVKAEWNVFKYLLFDAKMDGQTLEQAYEKLLQTDTMESVKYLACVFLALCLSTVWCERGFSLMAAIKTKSRNRMVTPTMDDQMMVQSNGPAVTQENKSRIDELLHLAFDHWSLSCTRMPSKSHPGVSRPRSSQESEKDVYDVLKAVSRQDAAEALAASRGQIGDRVTTSDDEDGGEWQDDEAAADAAEESRVSAENLAKVPPFVPPAGWIIIMPPDSEAELESYKWTEKRLAMKFEGGWSIGSFRRKGRRAELQVGQSLFFYKDKGSALLAHKLMLAECGPSKTWVIIQEVSKVISGNEATSLLHSVRGSSYAKHYNKRIGDARRDRTGDM
jgi:hypothetical protein